MSTSTSVSDTSRNAFSIPTGEDATLASGLEEILERAGTADVSIRDMQKALAEAHSTIIKQRRELLQLKSEVADLSLRQKRSNRDMDANKVDDEVKKLARYFQLFYSPYIEPSNFSPSMQKPTFEHDHPDRYANKDTAAVDGLTAEIYHCIPQRFHTFMAQSDRFKTIFGQALGDSRSQCLERLRTAAPKIFEPFNIPASYFGTRKPSRKRKSNDPVPIQGRVEAVEQLLSGGDRAYNTGTTSSHFPAILYKNSNISKSSYLFLGGVLFEIARIMLFGPKSGKNVGGASLRANSPYARQDRGIAVLPGLIAWVSIMARFILSEDTEFTSTGIGANSGNTYFKDFDGYKKIIIDSREERPECAKKHALNEGRQEEDSGEDFDLENQVEDIMQQIRGEDLTSESELEEDEGLPTYQPAPISDSETDDNIYADTESCVDRHQAADRAEAFPSVPAPQAASGGPNNTLGLEMLAIGSTEPEAGPSNLRPRPRPIPKPKPMLMPNATATDMAISPGEPSAAEPAIIPTTRRSNRNKFANKGKAPVRD